MKVQMKSINKAIKLACHSGFNAGYECALDQVEELMLKRNPKEAIGDLFDVLELLRKA